MVKKKTFEDSLNQLNEIVQKLEQGNTTLDESLKLYEEGVRIIRFCSNELEHAKIVVEELNAVTVHESSEENSNEI